MTSHLFCCFESFVCVETSQRGLGVACDAGLLYLSRKGCDIQSFPSLWKHDIIPMQDCPAHFFADHMRLPFGHHLLGYPTSLDVPTPITSVAAHSARAVDSTMTVASHDRALTHLWLLVVGARRGGRAD